MWGLRSDDWNNIGWLNHFEARSVDKLDISRKVEGVLYNSITKQATNIPNFTKSSLYVYVWPDRYKKWPSFQDYDPVCVLIFKVQVSAHNR